MADENNPNPLPEPPPVQTENPPPAPPVQTAPPPAAAIVIAGEKSEREIELERKLTAAEESRRKAEVIAAEKERENQELKKIPAVPKARREKNYFRPLIGADDGE